MAEQFNYRARVVDDVEDPLPDAEVAVIDTKSDHPEDWYVVDGDVSDGDGFVELEGLIHGDDRHHLIGQDDNRNGLSVPFAAIGDTACLIIPAGETHFIAGFEREYYDCIKFEDGSALEMEEGGAVEVAQIVNT